MLTENQRQPFVPIGLLGFFYCAAVLPLLFFRHDDWWILGNSTRYVPVDWNFLWKPTLYHGGREIIWFFRPGFKFLVWLFYEVFGLHYFLWMFSLLGIFLASLWVGFLTVVRISGSIQHGRWFVGAVGASFALHFGSLAWMGEGMMNVPQLFLLIFCTYAFTRQAESKGNLWAVLSWVSFIGALCFKESSLFHTALLAGLCVAEPYFRRGTWRDTLLPLLPFAVIAGVYLVIRLGRMPYNPSYVAAYTVDKVLRSSVSAFGPLLLPLFIWIACLAFFRRSLLASYFTELKRVIWYLPFLACSLVLYLGQDFFSPGWLLVVGVFTLFVLSLHSVPVGVNTRFIWGFAFALFAFSTLPIVAKLNSVGWWEWKAAQTEILQAVRNAPAETKYILVRSCENPKFPAVGFERVVANAEGMRQMAYLTHGREILVALMECSAPLPRVASALVLDWRFPHLENTTFIKDEG